MDVRELWRARVEGRFTLKHWVYAWLVSARLFAVPWVALYTVFGALLAGLRDPVAALGAVLAASLALLASHFRNNYRDVELGVDRYVESIEEAERVVSTAKPYTAAAWIVPLRITPVWFQKANEVLCLALSIAVYVLLVNPFERPLTVVPVALGLAMALTYTDFFKPSGRGEMAIFVGHGFSTTTLGYLTQSDDIVRAVLAGVAPGFISALAYSVDQYVDIKTDFVRRVRNIAEAWFNSRLPLGLYVLASYFAFLHLVTIMVVAGVYPVHVMLVYAATPAVILSSARVEYDRENGLRDAVLSLVVLVPGLMALGAWLA